MVRHDSGDRSEAWLEIRLVWGDSVLRMFHLRKGQVLRTRDVDTEIAAEQESPLAWIDEAGRAWVSIPSSWNAESDSPYRGKLQPGNRRVELIPDLPLRMILPIESWDGAPRVEVHAAWTAPPGLHSWHARSGPSWTAALAALGSAFVHVALLSYMARTSPPWWADSREVTRDELYTMMAYLTAAAERDMDSMESAPMSPGDANAFGVMTLRDPNPGSTGLLRRIAKDKVGEEVWSSGSTFDAATNPAEHALIVAARSPTMFGGWALLTETEIAGWRASLPVRQRYCSKRSVMDYRGEYLSLCNTPESKPGAEQVRGTARIRNVSVLAGPISEQSVREMLRAYMPQAAACYEIGLILNPKLQGDVKVSLQIGSDGSMGRIGRRWQSIVDDEAIGCVVSGMAALRTLPLGSVSSVNVDIEVRPVQATGAGVR